MRKKIINIKKTQKVILISFYNEDHTLGNILRTVIEGNPNIDYVGYNIPHPSENIMNLKISSSKFDSLEPFILGLKNSGELFVLFGNFFDYSIENHARGNF
ncbi:rpc9 (nucleomorph) [Hemiselmis andersenii]|uniref:Rpc9 n=1 Tax=Hemiselmis andersenii TaxID=464988 RepID=A9BL50_HEMAN|nr:rpc9 [Hemiselmis andersenii]ABW98233.1 rpc9 [Hemiselmis andersenii]|mmetsp:Transcript_21720/g.50396  ORF Transcript_21720/g.50396 Transcript_21720/m.50396 type:complete len:101 (-) Transcript_21720:3575-3877(-)